MWLEIIGGNPTRGYHDGLRCRPEKRKPHECRIDGVGFCFALKQALWETLKMTLLVNLME